MCLDCNLNQAEMDNTWCLCMCQYESCGPHQTDWRNSDGERICLSKFPPKPLAFTVRIPSQKIYISIIYNVRMNCMYGQIDRHMSGGGGIQFDKCIIGQICCMFNASVSVNPPSPPHEQSTGLWQLSDKSPRGLWQLCSGPGAVVTFQIKRSPLLW